MRKILRRMLGGWHRSARGRIAVAKAVAPTTTKLALANLAIAEEALRDMEGKGVRDQHAALLSVIMPLRAALSAVEIGLEHVEELVYEEKTK